jgi:polar amino acid transport system substrate-binding protein
MILRFINSIHSFTLLIILSLLIAFNSCSKKNQINEDTTSNYLDNQNFDIKLATLNWQPYIGEDLKGNGYVYELVQKAFEEEGLKVKIDFMPFARILILAKEGNIDGYFPEYYNEENKVDFSYSDPFQGGEVGFLKLKKHKLQFQTKYKMQDFSSLSKFKIGIVRGYTNTKEFDEANYLLKEVANSDLINLKKLLFNRLDLIFIDPNVSSYLIESQLNQYSNSRTSFEFIEPGLEYKDLYTCFSKKSMKEKKFLIKFNSGLKKLKSNGEYQKILKKYHFDSGRYVPIHTSNL